MQTKGFNKGGFTNTGYTADTNANTVATVGQYLFENSLCLLPMISQPTFDQGNCLGQCPTIARDKAGEIEGSQELTSLTAFNTARALWGIGVPGPKIQVTPAS